MINSFDFHIHTKYSYDSLIPISRLIKVAERRGLKGIAITDHETFKAINDILKIKTSLIIIKGEEIKTDEGDIIGLFLNEEIVKRNFLEVIDEIKQQEGVVVLPHPYKNKKNLHAKFVESVDIIEAINGRVSNEKNERALKLCTILNKPMIGGSDAHILKDVGRIKTIYSDDLVIDDEEDVKKVLFNEKPQILGTPAPHYLHYYTAFIGNMRKRKYSYIVKRTFGIKR